MEERLGRQIAVTAKAVQAAFDARLAEAGGSLSTWIVLQHAVAEGELSQRLLAQRISIEGPTLVRHLDRLEREGLVERRRDRSDRRVVRVVVTPAGKRAYERLRHVADETDAEMLSLLSENEHRTLTQVLHRLHARFDGADREDEREHQAG